MTTPEDESQLRRSLALIGDELAGRDTTHHDPAADVLGTESSPVPSEARGSRRNAWWPLAAAAAVILIAAVAVLDTVGPDSDPDSGQEATQSLTDAEWVSCSAGIGVGTVVNATPATEQYVVNLTVDVKRWLKEPTASQDTVTFAAMSGKFTDDPAFKPGQTVLFVLPDRPTAPADVFRADNPKKGQDAATAEALVTHNLDKSQTTPCPKFWRNRDNPDRPKGRNDS